MNEITLCYEGIYYLSEGAGKNFDFFNILLKLLTNISRGGALSVKHDEDRMIHILNIPIMEMWSVEV